MVFSLAVVGMDRLPSVPGGAPKDRWVEVRTGQDESGRGGTRRGGCGRQSLCGGWQNRVPRVHIGSLSGGFGFFL